MARTCPRNPRRKWLGLVSYEGEHEWEERALSRETEAIYKLVVECRLCSSRDEVLLRDEGMLRRGFDLRKLRTLGAMSLDDRVPAERIDEYREGADG